MRRREFLTLLGGTVAAWPLSAHAQQAASRSVIGVLLPISPAAAARNISALRAGMRDLGYSEGRDITLELRFADGAIERLPDLAAELVALKPAVIVAGSPPAAVAVRNATRTIPIVMNSITDPTVIGLASSIARPGGNVTGFWWGDEALIGKRLELLGEVVPDLARVVFIVNPDDPTNIDEVKQVPIVAKALGLTIRVLEVREPAEFEATFATAMREDPQGLLIPISPLFTSHRSELVLLAGHARVPAVYGLREFATAGGLMSYGANLSDLYRRKAGLIDKILKGAWPADLPIERPTTFELLINLKTAKSLGLSVPTALLTSADEVIE